MCDRETETEIGISWGRGAAAVTYQILSCISDQEKKKRKPKTNTASNACGGEGGAN